MEPKVNGTWQVTESLVPGIYDRAPTCSYVGEDHTPEIPVIPVTGLSCDNQHLVPSRTYVALPCSLP